MKQAGRRLLHEKLLGMTSIIATGDVITQLLTTKCLPAMLYGEVCPE